MPVLSGEKLKDVRGKLFSLKEVMEQAFSLFICQIGCSGRSNLQSKKDKPNIF